MLYNILSNPVIISVFLMIFLCLLRFNVLLSIIVSALVAGFMSTNDINKSINMLINGMQGNLETALSYILLGALAVAISQTNLTNVFINLISKILNKKISIFILIIAGVSCFSQNLIPVHIAFIPILIPPLLSLMNKLKIDRRSVACALTFGLQAPYLSLPIGFGLIFQGIIEKELKNNGLNVSLSDVSGVMWIGGLAMLIGLFLSILFYKKREYQEFKIEQEQRINSKMCYREWVVLIGAIIAFVVQLYTKSLPLGGLSGILVMVVFGGIRYKNLDGIMDKGLGMMAFIAFVMLVSAGFAYILRESNGIDQLVGFASSLENQKIIGVIFMLIIGLLVTMGIGTSFGTVPIIASIYVPFAQHLGISVAGIILLVGIAGAVGDAGSPASDSTLGPTSGLNADGQHNHIFDTCIPTFIFFNIPLIIAGAIGAMLL